MLEKKKRAYLFRHRKKPQEKGQVVEVAKENLDDSILNTILNVIGCFPSLLSDERGVENGARPIKLGISEQRNESSSQCLSLGTKDDRDSPSRSAGSQVRPSNRSLNSIAFPDGNCPSDAKGTSRTRESEADLLLDETTRSLERSISETADDKRRLKNQGDCRRSSQNNATAPVPSSDLVDVMESPNRSRDNGLLDRTMGVISTTADHLSNSADRAIGGLSVCGVEVPATVEETTVRLPRSLSVTNVKRTKAHGLPPEPDIIRNNCLVDSSPTVARATPVELIQQRPNLPEKATSASFSGSIATELSSSWKHSQRRRKAPATREGGACASAPTPEAISTIPAISKLKGKPPAGKHYTNRNRAACQNRIVLPPRNNKLLPGSIANTVRVSNVRSSGQQQELVRNLQMCKVPNVAAWGGETTLTTVEGREAALGSRHPNRQGLVIGYEVPLGLDPQLPRPIVNRDVSLLNVSTVSSKTPPKRKSREARNECMELVLAPSLEGVAIVKRRSSLKKKNSFTRSNSRIKSNTKSSGRRSPSRTRASPSTEGLERRYVDFH